MNSKKIIKELKQKYPGKMVLEGDGEAHFGGALFLIW